MIKSSKILSLALALGFLAMPLAGWAEPRRQSAVELSNMRNVLNVISHVSIRQNENRAKQNYLDILEMKGQIYGKNTTLAKPRMPMVR